MVESGRCRGQGHGWWAGAVMTLKCATARSEPRHRAGGQPSSASQSRVSMISFTLARKAAA